MRRYILYLVGCLAGIGTAQAQSASPVDWSGFHVGGFVGATWGQTDALLTSVTPNYFSLTDFDQFPRDGSLDISDWRMSGSLQGGFSQQFGNFVLGLDASGDALFLDLEKNTSFTVLSAPAITASVRHEVKADWMATLRPRLGWAQDRWQVYAMGGPALTRLKVTTSYDDNGGIGTHGRDTTSKMKIGWAAGLGGAYALDQNWALNMQFLYTDFGSVKNKTHVSRAGTNSDIYSEADLNTASIMLGVTYRFDGL